MIAVMKEISIAIDQNETNEKPIFWEYFGYLFCPVTSIFGPWTSFKDYAEFHRQQLWVSLEKKNQLLTKSLINFY